MPRYTLILATLFLIADQSVWAQNGERQPWEWTLEERIRDRSDPVKARDRVAASRAKGLNLGVQSVAAGVKLDGDSIDGRRNPELFLPIELFRIFVSGAFTEDPKGREVFRTARAELSSVPLPPDFWSELEKITRTYVTTLRRAQQLNAEAGAAEGAERRRLQLESETLQAGQCRTLMQNLEVARQRFGETFFAASAARAQLIGVAHLEGNCDLTLSITQGTLSSYSQVQFYTSYDTPGSCYMEGDHRIDAGSTNVDRLQWGVQQGSYSGTRTAIWQYSQCYGARNHGAAYPGGLNAPAVNGGPWNGQQQCAPPPPSPPNNTGGCIDGNACQQSESCPLILDLNGDGIRTTGLDEPVHFWIDLSGRNEATAWTNPNTEEAFLWIDLNHDHSAQVTELFGSRMRTPHGKYHSNGFEALDRYDHPELGGNGDGQITQKDAVWARLKLWVDRNHDAVSQPDEISVLSAHQIIALNLHHADGESYDENGNELYLVGSYVVRTHGNDAEYRLMADVEFRYLPNW